MKTKAATIINILALAITLGLVACGGGSSDQGCVSLDLTRNAALPSCAVSTAASATATALYTTAPSAPNEISIDTGTAPSYVIGGGTAPYSASSSNTNVASSTVNGTALVISGIASGVASVIVTDKAGKTVLINVRVGVTPLLTMRLSPDKFVVSESYLPPIDLSIYGGKGPYRAFTSDLEKSSVSIAGSQLTVGMGTKGTRCFPVVVNPPDPHYTYDVTITVVDSSGATATSVMTLQHNEPTPTCP